MDTDKILSDCLYQKCRNHRRVNTAGQCQQDLLISYLLSDFLKLPVNECLRKFRCCDSLHIIGTIDVLHSFSTFPSTFLSGAARTCFPSLITSTVNNKIHPFVNKKRTRFYISPAFIFSRTSSRDGKIASALLRISSSGWRISGIITV